ncbi:ribosome maturation factor RimP [Corynebacterium epidermidicanis]|nr:ribosome maturation factor RimP [Corynebacterium epidermidicanis]
MAFPSSEKISELIAHILDSHHLDEESIKVNRAGAKSAVIIAVDADDRPDLDKLEVVSGDISDALDAAEANGEVNFGAGYTLELSTPGVDTPLTATRHWRRNRGRKVAVTVADRTSFYRIGALNDAETSAILITREGKKLQVVEHELASEAKAVVEIEFANVPADEQALAELTYDEAITWREENK